MKKITTIKISEQVKDVLKEIREYPRETYEDTIKKLIEEHDNGNGTEPRQD